MFKKKQKIESVLRYESFEWIVGRNRIVHFDVVLKLIKQHNLQIRDLRFYDGTKGVGVNVLTFGLRGSVSDLDAFENDCYENKMLEQFYPRRD